MICFCRWISMLTVGLVLLGCSWGQHPKGGLSPIAELSVQDVQRGLKPRKLALVVGIDRFQDSQWPALLYAQKDAQALAEVLRDPTRGGFDLVTVLAESEQTRLTPLEEQFDTFARENTDPQDTVVWYFSTHGTLARDPHHRLTRYLVTGDTRQGDVPGSALAVSDLLERFDRLPSRRKALILATCHSGNGKSALPGAIAQDLKGIKGVFFARPIEEVSQASLVLSASGWGQPARESDALGHDIYTFFLLEALQERQADSDGDGAVTASEAHAYAMHKTYAFSRGEQRPEIESTVAGIDPVILAGERTRVGAPMLFSFLPAFEGYRVLVDGHDKGALPGRLALPEGSHRLVVESGTDGVQEPILDRRIEFRPGDELALESLLARPQATWSFSILGGGQVFLDPNVRTSYIGPLPLVRFTLARLGWLQDRLELGLHLDLGGARQHLPFEGITLRQTTYELSYGLGLWFAVLAHKPFELLLGPNLAFVHFFRQDVSPSTQNQQVFNWSPGFSLVLRWRVGNNLDLRAALQAHYYGLRTQAQNLDQGYLNLFVGTGWRW